MGVEWGINLMGDWEFGVVDKLIFRGVNNNNNNTFILMKEVSQSYMSYRLFTPHQ